MQKVVWMWNIPLLWNPSPNPSLTHFWKTVDRIRVVKTWFGVLLVWPAMTVRGVLVVVAKWYLWHRPRPIPVIRYFPPENHSWVSLSLFGRIILRLLHPAPPMFWTFLRPWPQACMVSQRHISRVTSENFSKSQDHRRNFPKLGPKSQGFPNRIPRYIPRFHKDKKIITFIWQRFRYKSGIIFTTLMLYDASIASQPPKVTNLWQCLHEISTWRAFSEASVKHFSTLTCKKYSRIEPVALP